MFKDRASLSTLTFLGFSILVALTDQIIKWLVQQSMAYGQSIEITPFFNWVHVWNEGAAFSLFADSGGWQRYFFIAIAIVVSGVLVNLILDSRQRAEALAYAMVLGGALGNVIDRVFRGYVVDYLDFHWQSWHWPAFNLADVFIVLGVIMILAMSSGPTKVPTNRWKTHPHNRATTEGSRRRNQCTVN
ncbi:lipoprotein signal peptidase [Marinobacter nanhaiticus D15-8W]|uniref:Lipoprotein signal peptidase n=1 Tax=Marinobacter nanhaiticus D15-8W TaxID=626887 RepID=N6W006_9GAMM|nr:signal peptidase II [Marinobacter nanhaiticus]ENO13469.1 lipoprotein signal peptidase [Marinobacter nanhaiticus D15-8W]